MKKLIFLLLLFPCMVSAKEAWRGWCEMGNRNVVTSGINSSTKVQQSFPQCTVSVFVNGGGLAVLYSDNNGTPLANPFISDTTGLWKFYAANGRYDVTTTQAGFPQPITYSDVLLCDPADAAGGSCGTGDGGTGCTLTGVDTGIVTEHPLGTCFDSIDATWDHTAFNLQFVGGNGAATPNTVGTSNTFMFGAGNNMSGESWEYALGDFNDLRPGIGSFSEIYALGDSNTVKNVGLSNATSAVIGFSNIIGDGAQADSGGHDTYIVGQDNAVYGGQFMTVLNNNNQVGTAVGAAGGGFERNGVVSGYLNVANVFTGTSAFTDFAIYGDLNDINGTADGSSNNVYIYGFTNHVENAAESFIYGFDNEISGPNGGDVTIVGASNFALLTNSTGTIGAQDNFIGGFLNSATSSGNYALVGGGNTAICNVCASFGFRMAATTNETVNLGISTTPELVITQGNVRRTPIGFAAGPVVNVFLTNGNGYTATGTVGQTCNVAFTGGTGSGGTATLYIGAPSFGNYFAITTGGSYTVAPTNGTVTNGTATCSGTANITSAVGTATACNAGKEGSFSAFVDSNTNTWGATIAGGGANHVLGYCDGTNWTVAAK